MHEQSTPPSGQRPGSEFSAPAVVRRLARRRRRRVLRLTSPPPPPPRPAPHRLLHSWRLLLKVVGHLPLASRARQLLQPVLRGLPRLVELVLLAFMGVLVALSTVRKLRK